MITYSLYAVIAGAVLRIFSAVGIAYVTTLAQADMGMVSTAGMVAASGGTAAAAKAGGGIK